jgi:hypothetical protein
MIHCGWPAGLQNLRHQQGVHAARTLVRGAAAVPELHEEEGALVMHRLHHRLPRLHSLRHVQGGGVGVPARSAAARKGGTVEGAADRAPRLAENRAARDHLC